VDYKLGDYGESATSEEQETIRDLVPWIRNTLEKSRQLPELTRVPLVPAALNALAAAPPQIQKIGLNADMATLTTAWFASVHPTLLEAAQVFQVWTMFADESTAESGKPYRGYVDLCAAALRENHIANPDDPILTCLSTIRAKLVKLDAAMLIDELTDAMTDSNQSWVLEQQWRKLRSYPTLAQYLAERENIVFTYVLAVLLRAHFRLLDPIPSAVVHHARSVSLITGLENDLISAYHEAQVGTPLTLLRVVQKEYDLDLQAAIRCATALTNSLRQRCDRLGLDLLKNASLESPLGAYIALMNQWADICYAWHLGARRYRMNEFTI